MEGAMNAIKRKLNPINYFKEPRTLYEAFLPLYVTSKIFCLAPISREHKEPGKLRYSLRYIYVFIYFVVAFLFLSGATYLLFLKNTMVELVNLEQKLQDIGGAMCVLLAVAEIIFGCVFAKKFADIVQRIDDIETALKELKLSVSYKRIYMDIILQLVVCLLAALYIGVFFVVFLEPSMDTLTDITLMFLFFLPYFVNLIMEVQYITTMRLLRFRFHDLNDYLGTILRKKKPYGAAWLEQNIKIINVPQTVLQPVFVACKEPLDPILVVDNVAALHIKLTDVASSVNTVFNVQLLLRVTIAFVSIVSALFVIGVNFVKAGDDDEKLHLNLMFTSWAFSGALEVWTIVWVTCKVVEEAKRCPMLMHKIRNFSKNIKLQDTIEHYSLQMYHNRLKFDVCGLFPLDYTLLYTIIAGVTTYLVILIQFNNSNYLSGATKQTTIT